LKKKTPRIVILYNSFAESARFDISFGLSVGAFHPEAYHGNIAGGSSSHCPTREVAA